MVAQDYCRRCLVSGRVQGVFFRASTGHRAAALGLRGWARNLDDGRVEVVACGPRPAVEDLCGWLWIGPAHAQVAEVTCEEPATVPQCIRFEIR